MKKTSSKRSSSKRSSNKRSSSKRSSNKRYKIKNQKKKTKKNINKKIGGIFLTNTCAICLEVLTLQNNPNWEKDFGPETKDYIKNDIKTEVVELYCGHLFHKDCIKEYYKYNKTCPLCRAPFTLADIRILDDPPRPDIYSHLGPGPQYPPPPRRRQLPQTQPSPSQQLE